MKLKYGASGHNDLTHLKFSMANAKCPPLLKVGRKVCCLSSLWISLQGSLLLSPRILKGIQETLLRPRKILILLRKLLPLL